MWVVAAWIVLAAAASVAGSMPCTKARLLCMYRTGCSTALGNYMMMCEGVISEPASACPKECEHALIALTSTEEGKILMKCECEDDFCFEAKRRLDICRSQVLKGAADATSSCSLSQLICVADAQCSTALQYYNELCRSMFRGRKCSHKCRNSIEILRKQEKAAALTACRCDGNEDYDCPKMQSNIERLCFHKPKNNHTTKHKHKHHKKVQYKMKKENVVKMAPPPSGAHFAPASKHQVLFCFTYVIVLSVYLVHR